MIVEVSRFRLVSGTNEEAFVEAAEEVQDGFLREQDGYLGRELLRGQDGSWMDIVRFTDIDVARSAFQRFAEHPAAKAFEASLDIGSIETSHWSVARSW
jgi:heme-degrading monooxygenase HmoA